MVEGGKSISISFPNEQKSKVEAVLTTTMTDIAKTCILELLWKRQTKKIQRNLSSRCGSEKSLKHDVTIQSRFWSLLWKVCSMHIVWEQNDSRSGGHAMYRLNQLKGQILRILAVNRSVFVTNHREQPCWQVVWDRILNHGASFH